MTDTKTIDDLYADAAAATVAQTSASPTPPTQTPEPAPSAPSPQDSKPGRRTWPAEKRAEVLAKIAELKSTGGARSGAVGVYLKSIGLTGSVVSLWRRQAAGGTLSVAKGGGRARATAVRRSRHKAAPAKMSKAEATLASARAIVRLLARALNSMD